MRRSRSSMLVIAGVATVAPTGGMAAANPTVRVERIAGPDVTVAVKVTNVSATPAAGYQVFMDFDATRLSLVPSSVVGGGTQYVTTHYQLPLIGTISASGGRVGIAAGVFFGQPPVSVDSTVAILRFVATDPTCIPEVFLPANAQPPTRLTTVSGTEIAPLTLVSMARICVADFDQNQVVEINDIFVFLNAWFAGSCAADMNGGGVEINDIFIFLNAWFTGCA